jgi:conjugative relaxase-like TrwC/TraI family protein
MLSLKAAGSSDAAASKADYLESYLNGRSDEPMGEWAGKYAEKLGIAGEKPLHGELTNGLNGYHPVSGEKVANNAGPEHKQGYEIVASAPKSVSVVWASADEQTRNELSAAHSKAVDAVIKHLEESKEGAFQRTKKDGKTKPINHQELAVAKYEHASNRNGEPNLHTHSMVLNLSENGKTVDIRPTSELEKNLGKIYRAELEKGVNQLGFSTEVDRDAFKKSELDSFKIKGVPRDLEKLCSTRREGIVDEIQKKGLEDTRKVRDNVALSSRNKKTSEPRADALNFAKEKAKEFGFDPAKIRNTNTKAQTKTSEFGKAPDREGLPSQKSGADLPNKNVENTRQQTQTSKPGKESHVDRAGPGQKPSERQGEHSRFKSNRVKQEAQKKASESKNRIDRTKGQERPKIQTPKAKHKVRFQPRANNHSAKHGTRSNMLQPDRKAAVRQIQKHAKRQSDIGRAKVAATQAAKDVGRKAFRSAQYETKRAFRGMTAAHNMRAFIRNPVSTLTKGVAKTAFRVSYNVAFKTAMRAAGKTASLSAKGVAHIAHKTALGVAKAVTAQVVKGMQKSIEKQAQRTQQAQKERVNSYVKQTREAAKEKKNPEKTENKEKAAEKPSGKREKDAERKPDNKEKPQEKPAANREKEVEQKSGDKEKAPEKEAERKPENKDHEQKPQEKEKPPEKAPETSATDREKDSGQKSGEKEKTPEKDAEPREKETDHKADDKEKASEKPGREDEQQSSDKEKERDGTESTGNTDNQDGKDDAKEKESDEKERNAERVGTGKEESIEDMIDRVGRDDHRDQKDIDKDIDNLGKDSRDTDKDMKTEKGQDKETDRGR